MLAPLKTRRSQRQTIANVIGLPFPRKGLNTRDRLQEKGFDYASIMDNIIPINGEGRLRQGYSEHVTGITGDVESLFVYAAGTTYKLFGSANSAVYDVTSAGTVGSAEFSSLNSTRWIDVMYSTTSGNYLIIANGADSVRNYNGSTWSTPTINNVTSADLSYVTTHKGRVWFIEKNTLSAWYLAANAISGDATEFPVGDICRHGGRLVAISSWSLDAGDGADDAFVMVTSEGEVLIYQGTDPGSDYALVGIFKIDRPVDIRSVAKWGGDLIINTLSGPVACSELLQARDPSDNQFADLVRPDFKDLAEDYSGTFGWQVFPYSARGWLIVNCPYTAGGETARQYVNNDGAWCRFTDIPAVCFAEMNGVLYFGGNTAVYKADDATATGDNDSNITGDLQWSWSRFGTAEKKRFTMARPYILCDAQPMPYVEMKVDYGTEDVQNQPTTTATVGATWDEATWDESAWAGSEYVYANWAGVSGVGTVGALRVRVVTKTLDVFKIQSAEIGFEAGGIL